MGFVELSLLIWRVICAWVSALAHVFLPARRKSVEGDICVITGAGMGIGRLFALEFAKLGATVVLWDVDKAANEETARQVEAADGKAKAYVCDVSNKTDVYRIAEQVRREVGDVSILVNNAGVVCGKTLLELPDEGIEKTFAVNTLAHFWTVKAFLPGMLANSHGHIISIASIAGHYGGVGLCDYSASKFGAVGFEECLRYEIRRTEKQGIYTTAAYPWIISTGMFEGFSPKEGWLLPPLEPQHAVDCIMHGILTNREVVFVPGILNFFTFLKPVLPMDAMWAVVKFFGIDTAMDTFKGRNKQD
ncbi:NADP-retinol dehydrogenase [Branchiostoma belcheri]|nr:NADP-retinol dehydrogenase [Branchiostoma belcheri]